MERITLRDGLELSELIAGYWRLMDWAMPPRQRLAFLQQHLELGVTSLDHADIYGDYQCEAAFGEALALAPHLRQQMELITKCGICLPGSKGHALPHYNSDPAYLRGQIEQSLQNLRTDYLDLVLLHRPDPLLDADEVAELFTRLRAQGKVRHFGVSNYTPAQFDLLQSRLDFELVTNQVEISPLNLSTLNDGTLDHLQQHRVRPMAWSCLGGGRLFNPRDEQARRVHAELSAIAEELGARGIDAVAYAWVRALPCGPLPILGSGKIERYHDAIKALDLRLSKEQWFRIWVAAMGHNVP